MDKWESRLEILSDPLGCYLEKHSTLTKNKSINPRPGIDIGKTLQAADECVRGNNNSLPTKMHSGK